MRRPYMDDGDTVLAFTGVAVVELSRITKLKHALVAFC
jgi:hypothetical protein